MSTVTPKMKEAKRTEYLLPLMECLKANGEDVLRVGSNAFAFPICFENGEEGFIKVVVQTPSGSRDGEPYDGYSEAETYELNRKQKAEKDAAKAKANAEKAKRDDAYREKQKANKEKRNAG